jgi:hypothetical protein
MRIKKLTFLNNIILETAIIVDDAGICVFLTQVIKSALTMRGLFYILHIHLYCI